MYQAQEIVLHFLRSRVHSYYSSLWWHPTGSQAWHCSWPGWI